jgi:hypothetical protein
VASEGFSNVWKTSEGADRYRRGLYTWLQRLSPYSHNVTFDAPPPNSVCTRRDRSNSPLQSLALLNDPVFIEAAEAMARSAMQVELNSDVQRIQYLFRSAFTRRASAEEERILMQFLNQQRQEAQNHAAAVTNEIAEQMAWTNLCTVILNQHEFITRD